MFVGWVAFRLFGFCGFYVGLCGLAFHFASSSLFGFCGFLLGKMRLSRLWLFASSALPVPLQQVAFWLCGFWWLSGFGFSHPLLSQLVFGLGFLHPQHHQFLSIIFSVIMEGAAPRVQFLEHHGGAARPPLLTPRFTFEMFQLNHHVF